MFSSIGLRRLFAYFLIAFTAASLLTYQLFFATRTPPSESLRVHIYDLDDASASSLSSAITPAPTNDPAPAKDAKPAGPRIAFATFLSSPATKQKPLADDAPDPYFIATKLLVWQLMHAEATRAEPQIPVLVLTTSMVTEAKKARLKKIGATVIPVEDVPLKSWHKRPDEPRWKDQFTKLRLFEQVQWDVITYIDADVLLVNGANGTRPGWEGVFNDTGVLNAENDEKETDEDEADPKPWVEKHGWVTKNKLASQHETRLPTRYLIASRPDYGFQGERNHPLPPKDQAVDKFNGGFWVTSPSLELFEHYMRLMNTRGVIPTGQMEQDLLNFAHRDGGPMPWKRMDWHWVASWPSENDIKFGIKGLHEKMWTLKDGVMYDMWQKRRNELKSWEQKKFGEKEW